MATRPARRQGGCGSAGGAPPEDGTPRRCPFLNTAGDGTQWDPRHEKHSPLFVPLGFLVPVSQIPSWEAFSLVSGCFGGRNSTVRFGSPFTAFGISRPEPRPAGSPPFSKATRPNPRGYPPSQRPLRGGGIMANFRSHEFLKMAGTRLVPPHSLAFRPEWYPRVLHPTPHRHASRQTAALRRVGTRRAERSSTRSQPPPGRGSEAAPGGLPHQNPHSR